MLCFVPVLRGCVWYVYGYVSLCKEEGSSPVSLQLGEMYEVPLSMSLLGLGWGLC